MGKRSIIHDKKRFRQFIININNFTEELELNQSFSSSIKLNPIIEEVSELQREQKEKLLASPISNNNPGFITDIEKLLNDYLSSFKIPALSLKYIREDTNGFFAHKKIHQLSLLLGIFNGHINGVNPYE